MPERILLRCRDIPDLRKLSVYVQHGGYEAAKKALTQLTPDQLVEMVKASNLRGRGGRRFLDPLDGRAAAPPPPGDSRLP